MTASARSYAYGTSVTPLFDATIGEALDNAAERWPSQEAVVVRDQGVRLTFSELREEVDRLAAGLIRLGLEPGDRIGIWSPNRIEWILTQYAAAKAGLILVNLNPGYRAAELEYALNKVECRALVTAARFKTTDYLGILRELAPELADYEPGALNATRIPHLKILIQMGDADEPGFYRFSTVQQLAYSADHTRLQEISRLLEPDDPVNIQFTSGTTGSPKAATLTHHGILNNAFFYGLGLGLIAGDRFCTPVPLYHVGGMVLNSICGIVHGITIVYLGEAFEPLAALEAIEAERCVAFLGVPTMFLAMLDHPSFSRYDLSCLRKGSIGGALCPVELMQRIMDDMHMRDVVIVYGMTELSGSAIQTSPSDTLERRVSTVGKIQPHMEVKLVDPNGHTAPHGMQGEICLRGYMVMRGYWNGETETAETIDSAGWLHSGDLGVMSEEGYITITGRSKDMVIRGGENIYPREIEDFLFSHPAVAEVQVFGVPDRLYGEELCAWIKLKPGITATEDDIRAFCRGRITHFKIPRYVRFVESYPMTVTGKAQKFVMREIMVQQIAGNET